MQVTDPNETTICRTFSILTILINNDMNIQERFGVSVLPENTIEKCALYKAVMNVVNADNIVTEEEHDFLIDLVSQMNMSEEMMDIAYSMSQEDMEKNISPEFVAVLDKAAEVDGNYSTEEKDITVSLMKKIQDWQVSHR